MEKGEHTTQNIEYKDTEDRRYVELPPSIDVYNHIEVKDKVIYLLKDTDKHFVLDMKKMSHIESSGISVIVTVQKLLENDNRKLVLTNLNKSIIEVLNYCKIQYTEI